MQEEIAQGDRRLGRFFYIFNLSWLIVSAVTLTYSALETFSAHPNYLYEWRAPVIFLLMVLVIALYLLLPLLITRRRAGDTVWPPPRTLAFPFWISLFLITRRRAGGTAWPPPRTLAFPFWISLFSVVTTLSLLDYNFIWCYFVVMGLTFGIFNGKVASALVAVIFLAYCWFLGFLAWPLTSDQLGAIFGMSITFASIALMCIAIQRLISERHIRDNLLQQLTRAHTELEEAHQRLTVSAEQEQELAVLRERTRLAREMHDTLGHALVLVSVKLEVAQRLRGLDPGRCDQELEATKDIVRSSMNELRASIANLRSPALEHEPACRALSRYARDMAQRGDLHISYDLHPDIEGLPEAIEETLWKVGQEALANIEKHAQAHNVLLHISRQNGQVFLKVADDGVGLPARLCDTQREHATRYQSPTGHYGLNGMLERVKNVQGCLSIHSGSEEQGTRIEVTLPLVEEPSLLVSSE